MRACFEVAMKKRYGKTSVQLIVFSFFRLPKCNRISFSPAKRSQHTCVKQWSVAQSALRVMVFFSAGVFLWLELHQPSSKFRCDKKTSCTGAMALLLQIHYLFRWSSTYNPNLEKARFSASHLHRPSKIAWFSKTVIFPPHNKLKSFLWNIQMSKSLPLMQAEYNLWSHLCLLRIGKWMENNLRESGYLPTQ